MLVALETLVTRALTETYARDRVAVVHGSAPPPSGGACVHTHATALQLLEPLSDEAFTRAGARETRSLELPVPGGSQAVTIPAEGEIAEVECPPGWPLVAGEDYVVEDRRVIFCAAPPARTVRVRLAGARTKGYAQGRPCTLGLVLTIRGKDPSETDTLLARTLNAVLVALADLPDLAGRGTEGTPVDMRVHRPVASLTRVTREHDENGSPVARLELEVRGQLELVVRLGEAPPRGRIEAVVLKTPVSEVASSTTGEGAEP